MRTAASTWLPRVLVALCAFWVALVGLLLVGNLLFLSSAETTEATVVGVTEVIDRDDGEETIKYKSRLEFTTASGETVRFESRASKFVPPEIGDQIEVLFDPDNPDQAVVDTFEERWYTVMLAGGLGLVLGAITGTVLYKSRKTRRARRAAPASRADDAVTPYLIEPVADDAD